MSEGNNFSIINLDGASDVIIKLLDMIKEAVGWSVIPRGSRADFEQGLAVYKESIMNDHTLNGIQKGAKISSAKRELKQYINQGKIISYAAENIKEDAEMDVDDDWFMYFFEYAKNITNDDVQKIWGKILAEKCNGDTSINRRLVSILYLLDAKTAQVFGDLCSITMQFSSDYDIKKKKARLGRLINIPILIPEKYEDFRFYHKNNFTQEQRAIFRQYLYYTYAIKNNLKTLKEFGLIDILNEEEKLKYDYSKQNIFKLDNELYEITHEVPYTTLPNAIDVGGVRLTSVGDTLYKLLQVEKYSNILIVFKELVKIQGFKLSE